jgi:hypothetical protein
MMVNRRRTLPLALVASLAVALPAGAAHAKSTSTDPVAHSAGGDAPPVTPSVVRVPLARADKAMGNAADAVEAGNGAQAIGPLRASRRYMIRAYRGAKFLIAQTPPVPADDASAAGARKFRRLARRAVRASRAGARSNSSRARARASQFAPPVLADTPTAVFSVFQGQYNAATTAVGMLPDVQGALLARVKTSLYTAIVLRNRLVKVVAAAAPPAPAEEGSVGSPSARAAQDEEATTFDVVMPGVSVLLGDEMQQMTATQQDTTVPAASSAVLADAFAADQQIAAQINLLWPPVVDD